MAVASTSLLIKQCLLFPLIGFFHQMVFLQSF